MNLLDAKTDPNFTKAITLGNVREVRLDASGNIVTTGGTLYREFRLDLGEPGNATADSGLINFSGLEFFTSTSPTEHITNNTWVPGTLGNATPRYNLDAGGDDDFTLRDLTSGNGRLDYVMYVNSSIFAGAAATHYLYLYNAFGSPPPTADGTFEEWAAQRPAPVVSAPPSIDVTKTVASTSISEGGVGNQSVTYTYTITNTSPTNDGDIDPVTITSISDDKLGNLLTYAETANGGPITLAEGALFSFMKTVTLASANAGDSLTNIVIVQGKDDENVSASATANATVNYTNVAPIITVVKTASVASVSEGGVGNQSVTYTYVVTNASPAGAFDPLSGVTLADTDGTPTLASQTGGDLDALLETGETWTYTLTVTLPSANAGASHTNTATATGKDDEVGTGTVSATANASVGYANVAPIIDVVKTGPATANVGSTVIYTYVVTNNSPASTDSELFFVGLCDSDGTPLYSSGDTDNDGRLDFGETWTYTLSAIMPVSGMTHTNTVTATGKDDDGTVDTDTDNHTLDLTFTLHGVKVQDHDGAGFGADDTVPNASFTINVYADTNNNGVYNAGIDLLAGSAMTILVDGKYSISGLMHSKTYFVFEGNVAGWVQTGGGNLGNNYYTHVVINSVDITGDDFANVRIVGSGGLSKGFWGNKNGLALLSQADFAGLTALNLRNADGSNRDFTGTLAQNKSALDSWLAGANATNMAYMLSAQLAATYLNSTVDINTSVAGVQTAYSSTIALIYVPAITAHNSQGAALEGNLNSGPNPTLVSAAHTVSIAAIIAAANAALGNDMIDGIADGKVVVGAGNPARNYYEALKNVLDALNNGDAILIA